jgi:hypothetical protein
VQRAPGFPCALCFSRDNVEHGSGALRREVADVWLLRCLKIKSEILATVSPAFAELCRDGYHKKLVGASGALAGMKPSWHTIEITKG